MPETAELPASVRLQEKGCVQEEKTVFADEQNQLLLLPKSRSQSPLKIRERLSHFFGYNHKRDHCDREDEDVMLLRQLIEEQESAEIESFKSDPSENKESLFDEETYLNTMRNTQSMRAPEEPLEPPRDTPMSRIFLDIFPEEGPTMKKEKEMIVDNGDYPLLKKWLLWVEDSGSKVLQVQSRVQSKIQLNETILDYKTKFRHYISDFQIHIFQNDIEPKQSSPELSKGGILVFRSTSSKGYKLWKDLLRLVLDDRCFNRLEQDSKNNIVGLTFIVEHSSVLVRIWIRNYTNLEQVKELCEFFMRHLDRHLANLILEARLVLIKDMTSVEVFKR